MKYTVYDLGQCRRGERIQVSLQGNAANVRLMDSSNYSNYRSGRRHRYYGGLVKRSPIVLTVPSSGHWYITIDLAGLAGSVRSSIRRLPAPLPVYDEPSLSSVPTLVRPFQNTEDGAVIEYDVFISHASEDKDAVVRPLANALVQHGLRVWYDEFELKIGDSLRRKIDKGLANSRFGIVVLSRDFIKKGWTNYELDGIISKAVSGEQVMLPIWHEITKQEIIAYSPSLADKVARNTSSYTIDEIANEIAELIRSK